MGAPSIACTSPSSCTVRSVPVEMAANGREVPDPFHNAAFPQNVMTMADRGDLKLAAPHVHTQVGIFLKVMRGGGEKLASHSDVENIPILSGGECTSSSV